MGESGFLLPMNLQRLRRFAVLLLACATARVAAADASSRSVALWDRFEQALANSRSYADRYRDVSLDVTYTSPDGRSVLFPGFYDGGQTWRIRFMPDRIGTWRYEARFSDGAPGATGSFKCVAGQLPGLIGVHAANPTWFGFKGEGAVTLRGFHAGDRFFARNWDDPADAADGNPRTAFLDWAARQGYNMLSIASHYLNRREPDRGANWQTPALWPLNASEYRQMESILDELARRRLIVFPFAGFFGRSSNFPTDPSEQRLYIRYTLARLAPYWNLLFSVGGPEPMLRGKPYLSADDINRLGADIVRHDPFGHAVSVHNPTGDDAFRDAVWHAFGTLQGPKTFDRRRLAAGLLRNHHPHKPLLAQETLWSGNSVHIRANKGSDYSDTDLRKNAYVIHFSGANLVFADNAGLSSTGFTGTMALADRKQSRHDILKLVWDTFAVLPFAPTRPAPELVASRDSAVFCLADPGRTYLVYVEASGSVDVQVTGGPYRVEWIDAQRPSRRERRGTTTDGRALTTPPGGDDWILVLTK